MTMLIRILIFILVFITPFFSGAIDLSKVEFNYLYKDSPVKMSYKIAQQDDVYKILISLNLKKISPTDEVQNFVLVSQKKFTSSKETPVEILSDKSTVEEDMVSYTFTFKVDPEHAYLVVKLNFLNNPYVFGIPVNATNNFPLPDFIITNNSSDQLAVKASDTLTLTKINAGTGKGSFFGYTYNDSFSPSLPPFSDAYPDANKKFVIESILPIKNKFIVPKGSHLYYVQNDTSSKKGVSFYSHEEYFPNTKTIDELIDPLIYIATDKEYKKLQEARDKKAAFDNFWLSLIPSQKLAGRTIRNYYRRVKQANVMFSDYKKGWKTDRAMIYIVYGPPDHVYMDEKNEIWEYDSYNRKIRYNFTKVSNLFTQYHYSLDRSRNYSSTWFSHVEKWRKGES